MRKAAVGLAVITLLLAAATVHSLVDYESARTAWSALSDALGSPDYDAQASDAAYARTEALLPTLTWLANGTAVALIALALALGSLAPASAKVAFTERKLMTATLIDMAALLVAAAPGWVIVRADPGLTLVITRLFPAVAVAWIAVAAASGRTIGARATRISLGTAPSAELGLRLVFAQPILLVVPLLLVMVLARSARGERPPARWLAPHLALARVKLPAH